MKDVFTKRLANLLSVKSLVTIILTVVFAYMAVTSQISQDFMTIYMVIIAFYFGTQSEKAIAQQQLNDGSMQQTQTANQPSQSVEDSPAV